MSRDKEKRRDKGKEEETRNPRVDKLYWEGGKIKNEEKISEGIYASFRIKSIDQL